MNKKDFPGFGEVTVAHVHGSGASIRYGTFQNKILPVAYRGALAGDMVVRIGRSQNFNIERPTCYVISQEVPDGLTFLTSNEVLFSGQWDRSDNKPSPDLVDVAQRYRPGILYNIVHFAQGREEVLSFDVRRKSTPNIISKRRSKKIYAPENALEQYIRRLEKKPGLPRLVTVELVNGRPLVDLDSVIEKADLTVTHVPMIPLDYSRAA